jgi:WD40 repeat protein
MVEVTKPIVAAMEHNRYNRLSAYELLHLPAHLAACARTADLIKIITDSDFLEYKTESGYLAELLNDLLLTTNHISPTHAWHQPLSLIHEALVRDFSFIKEHPSTLFQCLWNLCWWHDAPVETEHYEEREERAQIDQLSGKSDNPALYRWMEKWRIAKENKGPFAWMRSLRPPPEPLGISNSVEIRTEGYLLFNALVSPCGKFIVSSSAKGYDDAELPEIVLRDTQTYSGINRIEKEVTDIRYSKDGVYLAGGDSEGNIWLWNARTFQLKKEYNFKPHGIKTISWLSQSVIIAGCYDGTTLLVDMDSGIVLQKLAGHTKPVNFAGCTPDGTTFVTASSDHTIRLWDARTGTVKMVIDTGEPIRGTAISPDGKVIACACTVESEVMYDVKERSDIRLWDIESGELLRTFDDCGSWANCVAFSLDGKLLVSGHGAMAISSASPICLWQVSTGQLLYRFEGHFHGVTAVDFFPNGKRVLSSSFDKTLRVWDLEKIGQPHTRLHNHYDDVFGLTFSSDGKYIISSAWDDRRILLWDAGSGFMLRAFEGHNSLIRCFRFSDDNRYMISGSGSKYRGVDCAARLWEVATGRQLAVLEATPEGNEYHGHVNPVKLAGFTRDGQYLVTGHANMLAFNPTVDLLRIWDRRTGRQVDCYSGSQEDASRLIKRRIDDLQEMILKRELIETEGGTVHPLCGKLSNIKGIANWAGGNSVALQADNENITVHAWQGIIARLPHRLDLFYASSPAQPVWAFGKGTHLFIYQLEGMTS